MWKEKEEEEEKEKEEEKEEEKEKGGLTYGVDLKFFVVLGVSIGVDKDLKVVVEVHNAVGLGGVGPGLEKGGGWVGGWFV